MDFYVYDNIYTFNKRNPYVNPNSRLLINNIELPENGSFWFFTDMQLVQHNINIQKRYVHIHPGIGKTNNIKFKKTPKQVKRSDLVYNPKEKRVEVKDSIFPWKEPMFKKTVKYYGAELPHKKMSCVGQWIYNFGDNSIHFILDYMTQKIKYSWEEDKEEMAEFEQMMRVEELEEKIKLAELALEEKNKKSRFEINALRNADHESDL